MFNLKLIHFLKWSHLMQKRNVGTCPTIVKRKVVIKNVVGCSFLQNSHTLYAKEYV